MAILSDIRTKLRSDIGQPDVNNSDFTDSTINGFINEGIRFLGALVKQPRKFSTFTPVAGTAQYPLDEDTLIIRTAYFGDVDLPGDVLPLEVLTEEALKEVSPAWLEETESSRGRPRRIILLNRTTFLVHPTPDADESVSGKLIRLGFVYQPADITADGSSPDLPIVYHDLIPKYAQYLCYMGKLNEPILATNMLSTVIELAKKQEHLVIKDIEGSLGFNWSRDLSTDDGAVFTVRP